MWQDRAITEFKAWPTTLFGTITMSPQHHYEMDARIEAGRKAPDGQWLRYPVPISSLPLAELFRKRVAVFGEELQLYLKRLRKGDAKRRRPQVRYLLVAEAHDSDATAVEMRGRPHYHLLIHEQEQGSLFLGSPLEALVAGESGEYIRKKYQTRGVWRDGVFLKDNAFARQQWTWGFTKFQFAENEKAAGYLCKYLTKATQDRIRASLHYGDLEYLQHARSSNESLDSSRDVAQIGPSKD